MSEILTIQVREPLLYKGEHQEPGAIIDMAAEDAAACVSSGRAVLVRDGEAPMALPGGTSLKVKGANTAKAD